MLNLSIIYFYLLKPIFLPITHSKDATLILSRFVWPTLVNVVDSFPGSIP